MKLLIIGMLLAVSSVSFAFEATGMTEGVICSAEQGKTSITPVAPANTKKTKALKD